MRCTDVTRFVVVGTLKADTPAIQTEVAMCFHKTRIDVEATGINTFFVFQWLDAFADLGDLAILNADVGNVRFSFYCIMDKSVLNDYIVFPLLFIQCRLTAADMLAFLLHHLFLPARSETVKP